MLAEVGASAEVIGAFAGRFPGKAHDLICGAQGGTQEVDLEKVIHSMMTKVIREAGLLSGPVNKTPGRITVNVLAGGRRTSVKIRPELHARMLEVAGGPEGAKKVIQGFLESGPADVVNRSAYVNDQIQSYLLLSSADREMGVSRH